MVDVVDHLLQVPPNKRARGCTDIEIRKYCGAYTRLFQYMDLLSHYCYQPYGTLSNDEIKDVFLLVEKMDRLWRRIARNTPPKVHVWHHLARDLNRLRGLKNHNESKIEVSHQVGKQTELWYQALAANGLKKVNATMQYQANLDDSKLKERQAEVTGERARKFKSKTKWEERAEEKKRSKSDHINSVLELPEINDEFPSLLELTMVDIAEEDAEETS